MSALVPADALLPSSAADRRAHHCRDITSQLLQSSVSLKDVNFKCSDGLYAPAHKFILGAQCQYFKNILYRRGSQNLEEASIVGKTYAFGGTSACFHALMQYLYTGSIQQVEGARAALDPLAPELESLLRMARTPHRDGFGGVDKYLIRKLCVAPPPSAAAALGRLSLAQGIKCDPIIAAMRAALPSLPFTETSFSGKGIEPEVVELVLREIPLAADELTVCRAVAAWAVNFYPPDSDDEDSSASGDGASAAADRSGGPATGTVRPERLLELPPGIVQLLDLSFVSPGDIKHAVAPLRIFRRQDIVAAMRDHLRRGTIDVPTCQNTRRGAAAAAAPGKDAPAADGLAGLSLNHNAR